MFQRSSVPLGWTCVEEGAMFQYLDLLGNSIHVWSTGVHHKPFGFEDIELQVFAVAPCVMLWLKRINYIPKWFSFARVKKGIFWKNIQTVSFSFLFSEAEPVVMASVISQSQRRIPSQDFLCCGIHQLAEPRAALMGVISLTRQLVACTHKHADRHVVNSSREVH